MIASATYNTASGNSASVSGGNDNTANGQGASVSGGSGNTAADHWTTAAGGHEGTISDDESIDASANNYESLIGNQRCNDEQTGPEPLETEGV